ncbi:MAG: hypothetical protein AAFQ94_27075 [Bacteroidota bacterium]
MKKITSLFITATLLLAINMSQAQQKSTELYFHFAPNSAFTNIKSLEMVNDAYVNDRIDNEPDRGGVNLGVTIEKSFKNFSIQTGLLFTFYGLKPIRRFVNPALNGNNPDRVYYVARQEFYFASIPIEFKKDLFTFNKASKNPSKQIDFSVYVVGGMAGQYMFQSNYERKYRLLGEREETTINEFENSFDSNPLNMTIQGGIGLQTKLNQNWSIILQPTLSHQLLSIYNSGISEKITTLYTVVGVGMAL